MSELNIFNYATKELSQDAFFAWLLMCSREDTENIVLRKKGKEFAERFFGEEYSVVDVLTQVVRIDILVILEKNTGDDTGKLFAAIIEDKTTSFLGEDQMKKYCEKVSKKGNGKQKLNDFWKHIQFKYRDREFVEKLETSMPELKFCIYIRSDYLYKIEKKAVYDQFKEIRGNYNLDETNTKMICYKNDKNGDLGLDELFAFESVGNPIYDNFVNYYNDEIKKKRDILLKWKEDEKWMDDERDRYTFLRSRLGQLHFLEYIFKDEDLGKYVLGQNNDINWPSTLYYPGEMEQIGSERYPTGFYFYIRPLAKLG